MSASPTLTIAVTALGDLRGPRAGAALRAPGRATWWRWPGRLGYAAAGYTVLSRGLPHARSCWSRRTGGREVPYAAGPGGGRGSAPPR